MTASAPRICCLDLDTFFVSVERVLDPALRGKPVIVGGQPGTRGVVTACSYEVRELGVRSGMSLTEAGRLAPNAIYLPVRSDTYGRYSEQVREIAERWCPVIRVASIDELYMDFRGCERMHTRGDDASDDAAILRVVRGLAAEIHRELGLPASAGIATSKSMAKIASGLAKPAGVRLIEAGQEPCVLAPLPVRRLPGVGPVAERRLHAIGITTLGQLAATPLRQLRRVFGAWAEHVKDGASGRGSADLGRERPAFHEHDRKGELVGSISNERTFNEDVENPAVIESVLCGLCERVCWRARRRGVRARTVSLKLRYADFQTLSRSRTLATPSHSELELYPVVMELYRQARRRRTRVRLLGLALSNLGLFGEQLPLFPEDRRLHETVDAIRSRYGFDALRLAGGAKAAGRRLQ